MGEKLIIVPFSYDRCGPEEEIDIVQALDMVNESKKQIKRMDTFVETMRKISSLDTRKLVAEEITSKRLEIDLRAELNVFEKEFGKGCELECLETAEKFSGDKEVILEVIENLLSNAFRYANDKNHQNQGWENQGKGRHGTSEYSHHATHAGIMDSCIATIGGGVDTNNLYISFFSH